MKIMWICSSKIGPYYYYMFKALYELIKELIVICIIEPGGQHRPWPEIFKTSLSWKMVNFNCKDNIFKLLNNHSPDFIVVVGNKKPYIYSAIWAKLHRIPCVFVSDTPYNRFPNKIFNEKIKVIVIKLLFSGLFIPGKMALNYRISQGFPLNRIWRGLCVTDIEHFKHSKSKWIPPDRFPEKFFLTVCRLSKEKNINTLLEAFLKYRENGGEWGLVIIGSGPKEKELKSSVPSILREFIYWGGWIGYNDLPALFRSSSCFILPSLWEPWGVVVNEALSAGLPILLSKNCGCVPDLCQPGVNGFLFDPLDFNDLAELMLKISSDELDLVLMGKASEKIITNYTPKKWAETVVKMCETILNKK